MAPICFLSVHEEVELVDVKGPASSHIQWGIGWLWVVQSELTLPSHFSLLALLVSPPKYWGSQVESSACLSSLSAYHDGGAALCQGCRLCADEVNAPSQCPAGHLHPQTPYHLGTRSELIAFPSRTYFSSWDFAHMNFTSSSKLEIGGHPRLYLLSNQ